MSSPAPERLTGKQLGDQLGMTISPKVQMVSAGDGWMWHPVDGMWEAYPADPVEVVPDAVRARYAEQDHFDTGETRLPTEPSELVREALANVAAAQGKLHTALSQLGELP